jgi:penicillin-binding protein 1A
MVGSSPKAMLENPDAKYSLNHAVQIRRQPGSAFKPFIYASALQKGINPDSRIDCRAFTHLLPTGETWSPRGFCNDTVGTMTLTRALTTSVNSVAARLITQVTNPGDVISLVQRAGIESRLEAVPSLSLGAGGDVSPLEITAAYGMFANNGIFVTPYFFDRIEDRHGEVILERKHNAALSDVLELEIAGQMTYMMQQVINSGTATRVRNFLRNVDAAGKTGTTDDAADAWFIGYTPQLVCGIWLGFDDKRVNFSPLGTAGYGGRIAAPLWGAIMAAIYDIPNIPYRQRRFGVTATDSSDMSRPYSLTSTQLEQINLERIIPIVPDINTEQDDIDPDEETRRRTFLPDDAMLFNNRKFLFEEFLYFWNCKEYRYSG